MYDYQKNNRYFAQVTGQMEELCAEELEELGAKEVKTSYRGVYFNADKKTLYSVNYKSRLASRILAPITSFRCDDVKQLSKYAIKINWSDFFGTDCTFAITARVSNSKIKNSLAASQYFKDGIVDYFRKKENGRRPSVDTKNPDVRLSLRIEKNFANVSLDTSGESLHKRGYRLSAGKAPMQETLAAAIIRLSKWDGEKPLWDCMCGSGTILCEALMHFCRIPAQYLREDFGFQFLPDYDKKKWLKVKSEADDMIRPLPSGLIMGSDKSEIVLRKAKENLSRLNFSENIELTCQPFQRVKEFENGVLITNPPYGIRMGEIEKVKILYTELGDFLKQKCNGTSAFIYSGDPSLRKEIGLRTTRRIPLVNGKLKGVLMQIDSYKGSKKKKYQNQVPL